MGVFTKIQEICTKIDTRIFQIDQEMTDKNDFIVGNPLKIKLKILFLFYSPLLTESKEKNTLYICTTDHRIAKFR